MADEPKVGIRFEDVQSASGVDLTLIDEQLKLTPTERLRWLEKANARMNRLRRAANVHGKEPEVNVFQVKALIESRTISDQPQDQEEIRILSRAAGALRQLRI